MNSKSAAKLAACASLALFLSGIPSQKACAQEQEKKVVVEDADDANTDDDDNNPNSL